MAAAVATRSTRNKRSTSKSATGMNSSLPDDAPPPPSATDNAVAKDNTSKHNVANSNTAIKRKQPAPAETAPSVDQVIDPSLKNQGTAGETGIRAPSFAAISKPSKHPAQGLDENLHSLYLEPNPFEQSFGNPPTNDTPNKSVLPPVAALASPSLQGPNSLGAYGWPDSLRSGPLSPAMLTGPTTSDLYGSSLRGFPTPNESSLRTGLTPGGGGSMFPAPSPNTQALFNSLASGGTTPGTLDFQRTAMSAHLRANRDNMAQPQFPALSGAPHPAAITASLPNDPGDPFSHHDGSAADAANGLYMLAQARTSSQNAIPFTSPASRQNGAQDGSQNMVKQAASNRVSRSSNAANTTAEEPGSESAGSDNAKPSGKRVKKGKSKTGQSSASNRRKAEDSPTAPKSAAKRVKQESSPQDEPMEGDMEGEDDMIEDDEHPDGRKMTDEEKRKNFLERNRVAALKCRQRKKQWLANLQAKVEIFSSENDALSAQVTSMREEIVNLKTLLIAHKECPIGQAQGLGAVMGGVTDFNGHHPYSMAMSGMPAGIQNGMQNGGQILAGQSLQQQRRFS